MQTIGAAGVDGVPGGVTQVKEVAAALVRVAKTRDITTVLVGHVTKDGSIAGPRVLEHIVDVVLHFEGDRNSRFRMLRAMKNRFGPVDEVGCFDLGAGRDHRGHRPDRLFVEHHHGRVPGTCVAVTMEGRRPLLAEVQALVARQSQPSARGVRRPGLDSLAARDGARRARAALRHPARTSATSSPRPSAAPSSPSRRPTSRSRSRWPRRPLPQPGSGAGWSRWARSAWPASCAGSATCQQRLAEAARLGFAARGRARPSVGAPRRRRDGRRDAGRRGAPTSASALRLLDLDRALPGRRRR